VLRALGAPERRMLRRRAKSRDAPPSPEPEPVVTSRATLVDTDSLSDAGAASRWLRDADLETVAEDALRRLNRVLHAHRIAAADPWAREVSSAQALVIRVGHGEGEDVSDGRWSAARELPRGEAAVRLRPGRNALRPQERLAAILGRRDAVLACEDLALRTRADLDAGRLREAALQLRIALESALTELEPWRERPMLPPRLDALHERADAVRDVAGAALLGGLTGEQVDVVRDGLRRVEAALRARIADGVV
jgi:hypothetical protein